MSAPVKLYFSDEPEPQVDEIKQGMMQPLLEQLAARGFVRLGLMYEKGPLWSGATRELVLTSTAERTIASVGFRGLKLSYYFYTPFTGGQIVITACNSFRDFFKEDFVSEVVTSGEVEEMLEIHKKAVAGFEAKGYVPFNDYGREAVVQATQQYYRSPYPKRQLRVAGTVNALLFIFSVLLLALFLNAAVRG
jgi:hypothetical protein